MVINVLDHVSHCYTWQDGAVIRDAIRRALDDHERVAVSFAGVQDVPTSFVNAAFVSLLKEFSQEELRRRLAVINSTRQINDMIRRRLEFETKRADLTTQKVS